MESASSWRLLLEAVGLLNLLACEKRFELLNDAQWEPLLPEPKGRKNKPRAQPKPSHHTPILLAAMTVESDIT